MTRSFRLVAVSCMAFTIHFTATSQSLSINTDGSTAHSSALLDVKSTSKGVLVPRMSKTEKNAIATPATGLMVFQNAPDSIGFHYYDGTKWAWIQNSAATDSINWKTFGNTGLVDSISFIGNIDDVPINFRINNQRVGKLNRYRANYAIGRGAGGNDLVNVGQTSYGDSAGASIANNFPGVYIGFRSGVKNTGTNNTFVGSWSGEANTTGSSNAFFGTTAGIRNTTGSSNAFLGHFSGYYNTSGSGNTAVGTQALLNDTSGDFNVAVGFQSMLNSKNGNENTAVGSYTLYSHYKNPWNVAVGEYALYADTSGTGNMGIGTSALRNNLNSNYNTAAGTNALFAHKTGDYNTAIGFESMRYDTAGFFNTAMGWRSLRYNLAGNQNTALGVGALESTDSATGNTAIGRGAMIGSIGNTTNLGYNTVVGYYAGALMDSVEFATAIGTQAGYNNRGRENTFVGYLSGYGGSGSDLTGIENTAIGTATLTYNNTGKGNTALGLGVLYANRTGNGNVGIGTRALANAQSYSYNIAIGDSAMYGNNANENMAIGTFSMRNNNTGTQNSAVGNYALQNNNTGSFSTALGHQALVNSNANGNTGLGYTAGSTNTSGTFNTLLGYNADVSATNFTNASAIGANAYIAQSNSMVLGSISGVNGAVVTSSVGIGTNTPNARLHIQRNGAGGGLYQASSAMIIEDNASAYLQFSNPTASEAGILSGNAATNQRSSIIFRADSSLYFRAGGSTTRMVVDNNGFVGIGNTAPADLLHVGITTGATIRIGSAETLEDFGSSLLGVNSNFVPTTNNLWDLGSATYRWNTVYATVGTINTSDGREKENITDLKYGLNEILKLHPVIFNWKENPQWGKKIGFIAQEVQPVLNEVVQVGNLKSKPGTKTEQENSKNSNSDRLGIYYSDIIPVTVKAIQEQQQLILKQQKTIDELVERIKKLENK